MKKKLIMILLLVGNLMLAGCYGGLEVNDTVVPTGRGVDIQDGKKVYSAQLAKPQGREESSNTDTTLVVTEKGDSFSMAARSFYLFLPRKPLWSMINTTIIGENLAREDISLCADFFARNPNVRLNSNLFLAYHTTPEEIFKVKVPMSKYSAQSLAEIIKIEEKSLGIYMKVDVREFLFKAATAGIEQVLPQVIIEKNGEEERLRLDGTAVFLKNKMVGSLDEAESRGLRFLKTKPISGGLFSAEVPLGAGDKVTLELIDSVAKIKPIFADNKKIKMQIRIKADGNFYEQNNDINYLTPENILKVEQAANQAIEKDIMACIKKSQALKSDVMGWGLHISRKNPEIWVNLKSNWPEIFAEIETEITVDFKFRRGYLIDTVFKSQD